LQFVICVGTRIRNLLGRLNSDLIAFCVELLAINDVAADTKIGTVEGHRAPSILSRRRILVRGGYNYFAPRKPIMGID
jgi:hypothetical protein